MFKNITVSEMTKCLASIINYFFTDSFLLLSEFLLGLIHTISTRLAIRVLQFKIEDFLPSSQGQNISVVLSGLLDGYGEHNIVVAASQSNTLWLLNVVSISVFRKK